MNHASTLRHSRAHRAAATRNAKAISANFFTRVTIQIREDSARRIGRSIPPKGVRVFNHYVDLHQGVEVFVFDIYHGSGFAFDANSSLYRIVKTERIRK